MLLLLLFSGCYSFASRRVMSYQTRGVFVQARVLELHDEVYINTYECTFYSAGWQTATV